MRSIYSKALMVLCLFAGGMAATAQPIQLLNATNTSWRWMAQATDPGFGTDWKDELFGDAGPEWSSGIGLFGTETSAGITVTYTNGWAFNTVVPPPGTTGGPQCSFYRTHFNWVGSTQGVLLTMTNLIDDGMVVFLNGTEIYRYNMNGVPGDPVVWSGTATSPTANPPGEPNMQVATVDPTAPASGVPATLKTNDNVIAVFVGQAGATSSDTVFGMWLYASQCIGATVQHPPPGGTNISVVQCRNLTMTVQASGLPNPSYQWLYLGNPITDATNASHTIVDAQSDEVGAYTVQVGNSCSSITSPAFNVTVTDDLSAPQMVSAQVNAERTQVIVSFNEPLRAPDSSDDEFNWLVEPAAGGLNINDLIPLQLQNGTNLVIALQGGAWVEGTPYRVRDNGNGAQDACTGIQSLPNNVLISLSITVIDTKLQSSAPDQNFATLDPLVLDTDPQVEQIMIQFQNIFGSAPGQILAGTNIVSARLRINQTDPGSPASVYRMLVPWDDETVTWSSMTDGLTNDGVEMSIAADFVMANGANGIREFDVAAAVQAWSDNPSANYGWGILPGGGDGFRWNSAENANNALRPQLIIIAGPPPPVSITTQPPANVVTNEGATVNLTVVATGSRLTYQWQQAPHGSASFVNILNATNATLTVTNANPTHTADYRVVVSGSGPSSQTSTISYVQITPDTTPPTVVNATAEGDLTTIRVRFSEPMAASAGANSTYTVSGVTVTSVALSADGMTALVTTTPRTYGATHTVTVQNTFDRAFTPNPLVPFSATVRSDISCFVRWDALWRWVQDDPLLDQSGWETGAFDDSGWTESAGLFGLEPGSNAVLAGISPYTIQTAWTVGTAQPTYYLRKQITVPALPAGSTYIMRHLIDDGALVYIDGTEVIRYGTNAGPQIWSTNYLQQPAGGDANLLSQAVPLTAGSRLIAVEVHQTSAGSSDVLFGAEFCIVQGVPRLTITRDALTGQTTVSWAPQAGILQESTDLVTWANSARQNGVAFATPATGGVFYRIRF